MLGQYNNNNNDDDDDGGGVGTVGNAFHGLFHTLSLTNALYLPSFSLSLSLYMCRMDNAFQYDETAAGICSEEDYPYAGHKRWFRGCMEKKQQCEDVPHTIVDSFVDVNQTVADLMEAIALQPVSVAIEADEVSHDIYPSICPLCGLLTNDDIDDCSLPITTTAGCCCCRLVSFLLPTYTHTRLSDHDNTVYIIPPPSPTVSIAPILQVWCLYR